MGSGRRAGEGAAATFGRGQVIWPLAEKQQEAAPEEPVRLGSARWIWFKEGRPAAAAPVGKRYFRRLLRLEGGD